MVAFALLSHAKLKNSLWTGVLQVPDFHSQLVLLSLEKLRDFQFQSAWASRWVGKAVSYGTVRHGRVGYSMGTTRRSVCMTDSFRRVSFCSVATCVSRGFSPSLNTSILQKQHIVLRSNHWSMHFKWYT